jgi:hypothetical protein
MTEELAKERGLVIDRAGFEEKFRAHQELSRTASAGMFKGGLADGGEETTALHSATHIMLAGLRKVLGDHVHQAGSNITPERLRFDFTHSAKMNPEEIKAVEEYVNSAITSGFDTAITEESKDQARERGVEGSFWEKYPDIVKVYTMKWNDGTIYSQELCGGPHVPSSKDMGVFKIMKEEASSAWVRRIKAVLEKIKTPAIELVFFSMASLCPTDLSQNPLQHHMVNWNIQVFHRRLGAHETSWNPLITFCIRDGMPHSPVGELCILWILAILYDDRLGIIIRENYARAFIFQAFHLKRKISTSIIGDE